MNDIESFKARNNMKAISYVLAGAILFLLALSVVLIIRITVLSLA